MDTYVCIYDQHRKGNDDNPTIGLILCSEQELQEHIQRERLTKRHHRHPREGSDLLSVVDSNSVGMMLIR